MTLLELVHPRETHKLPIQRLHDTCTLFTQAPNLLNAPYSLKSRASLQDFRAFAAALEDRPLRITAQNFAGLLRLCDEFGFESLSVRLSDFLRSGDRELRLRVQRLEEGALARERQLERLEEELGHRLRSEADLSRRLDAAVDRISRLEASISDLMSEIEGLRGRGVIEVVPPPAPEVAPPPAAPPEPLLDSVVASLLPFFDSWRHERNFRRTVVLLGPSTGKTSFVSRLASGSFPDCPAHTIGVENFNLTYAGAWSTFLDTPGDESRRSAIPARMRAATAAFLFFDVTSRDSFEQMESWLEIICCCHQRPIVLLIGAKSDLADKRRVSADEARQFADDHGFRYAEVSSKTGEGVDEALRELRLLELRVDIRLLYRGSEDGFSAEAFHRCCDGQRGTLTVVRDTDGNVFGGFAVPAWERPFFSQAKADASLRSFLFTLKNPHKLAPQIFKLIPGQEASAIRISRTACACFGNDDLFIVGGCDASPSRSGGFGSTYQNDTGIDGRLVFTGSDSFIVSEIEVFWVYSANKQSP
jgi:hypothetical protein